MASPNRMVCMGKQNGQGYGGVLHNGGVVNGKSRLRQSDIGVIGVPLSHGQPRSGAETAPNQIRNAGLIKRLSALGMKVEDCGDVDCPVVENDQPHGNTKRPRTVGKSVKNVSDAVNKVVESGRVAVTLGGDHSMAIGTIHGHLKAKPDACVIWIDAHGDINTPLTSDSGNIHGMPVSFLLHELKEYVPNLPGFEWLDTVISTKSLAYIGLRDVDPGEAYIIEKFNIPCFSMYEIDRYGIDYCVREALKAVNPGMNRPIHLSFDIDALTPSVAPSTGTPVPGGLSLREGMYICEEISKTGLLSAVDLAEVNTILGDTDLDRELTLNSAIEIICSCFGRYRGGNYPEKYHLPKAEEIVIGN